MNMEKFIKDYSELDSIKGLTSSSRRLYNEMRNFLQLSKKNKEYQDENGIPFIFFTEGRAKEIGISITTYKRAKKQLKDLGLINYSKQPVKKLGIASKIYVEEDLKKVIKNSKALDPDGEIKKVETKKTAKKVTVNSVADNNLIEMLLNEIREIKKQNEELNNKVDELTKKVDELSNNQKPPESIVAKEESINVEVSTEQKESTINETNTNKIENNTVEPTPFFKGKLGFKNDIDRLLKEWEGDPIKIKDFEVKEPKKKRTRKVKPKLSFEDTMKFNEGRPFMYEDKWYSSDGKPYVHNTQVITKKVTIRA